MLGLWKTRKLLSPKTRSSGLLYRPNKGAKPVSGCTKATSRRLVLQGDQRNDCEYSDGWIWVCAGTEHLLACILTPATLCDQIMIQFYARFSLVP